MMIQMGHHDIFVTHVHTVFSVEQDVDESLLVAGNRLLEKLRRLGRRQAPLGEKQVEKVIHLT